MVTRVLVVGLDSADWKLIEHWIAQGTLPTLAGLRANGFHTRLSPPQGLGNNAAWPSFFTGSSPAKHGRYGYRMVAPGSYETRSFRPEDYRAEPFWLALDRAGRETAVIDVPKAPLARSLHGVQLADWAVHDTLYSRPCSWPREWASEVIARHGKDTVEMCDGHDGSPRQLMRMRDRLLRRVEQKTRLVCEMLERRNWDLFCVVFADAHCAGHHLWHLHARHSDAVAGRAASEDPLREIYAALDAALGRVLESAGDDARVLVFSALGMTGNRIGHDLLDEILRRFERSPAGPGRRMHDLVRRARHWVPLRLRRRFGPQLQDRMDNALLAGDRSRRTCFVEPHNDILGGIRINLAGREPCGRIEPGSEYESVCERLVRQLRSLVDADSRQPAVRRVFHSRDLYPDASPGHLPDLFVEWNTASPLMRLAAPEIGEVVRAVPLHRTGNHTSEGFLLAAGPGVPEGASNGSVFVSDLAPTVAAWFGITLPGSDGAPIVDLVAPDSRAPTMTR